MIIEPKVREYICTTAHPQGCAESVRNQADYACKQGMVNGTKKALIIGCSTGYGLASRICALENCGADTLGIMFDQYEKRFRLNLRLMFFSSLFLFKWILY